MDKPPHPIKVFGLQRCGTNLMQALLTRNFHVEYLEEKFTGWKHGPLRMPGGMWQGRPARFALCVKNPYAWAVSCYRFFRGSQGLDGTMDPRFQRDPSMSFEEFLLSPSYTFETPIHRWNQMNRLWLSTLPADRTLLVRQEDQLGDQLSTLLRAEERLGLARLSADLQPIEQRVDIGAKLHGEMERDYYQDRHYLLEYSPLLLDRVNSVVDLALLGQLGYPLERWALEERQIGPLRLCVRPFTDDAAEARQLAADPHRFLQIKQRGQDVQTFLDGEAGTGASVLLAKALWGSARVIACEKSPLKHPLLQMNTRHLADVRVLPPGRGSGVKDAITEGLVDDHDLRVHIAGDHEAISGAELQACVAELGQVDVVKLGSGEQTLSLLQHAVSAGYVSRMRWICAALAEGVAAEAVCGLLASTHETESWQTPSGTFLLARSRS